MLSPKEVELIQVHNTHWMRQRRPKGAENKFYVWFFLVFHKIGILFHQWTHIHMPCQRRVHCKFYGDRSSCTQDTSKVQNSQVFPRARLIRRPKGFPRKWLVFGQACKVDIVQTAQVEEGRKLSPESYPPC